MDVNGRRNGLPGTPSLATLHITPEILALIAALDEFKGGWKALGTLAPEKLRGLQKVASIESIGSSTRIEGALLTDRQIETILSNLSATSFSSRDEQEVAGYADVMETVFASWESIPVSENYIKQLHRDLLRFSDRDARHRGEYKAASNSVAAFDSEGKQIGIVFETASPFETPGLMRELVDWTREELDAKRLHPLLVIAVFLVMFLAIHPFQDGNGRLSRVLTTLLLLRAGYAYVPYSSLESVIEQNKERYYRALRRTQSTLRSDAVDWEPWVLFFLNALSGQMRALGGKIEKERILMAAVPETALRILDHVKTHGRASVGEMAKLTGISRNTLKSHFQKLAADRRLILRGEGRGAYYTLGEGEG